MFIIFQLQKGTKRATQQQQQQQQQLGHQIFSSAVAPTSISSATAVAGGGGGYGQFNATAISTPTSFATAGSVVSSSAKGPTKGQKGQQQQQQHQQFQHYQSSSPLIADSPIPSPSGAIAAAAIKPPTPQPQQMQMLPQQFTISQQPQQQQQAQQVFQFIQGPQGQLIATTPQQQQPIQQQQQQQPQPVQQQQQHRFVSNAGVTGMSTGKTGKAPQQILPKPQQELQQQKKGTNGGAQISQSAQQTGQANNPTQQQQQQQQQQILLPATTNQPQQLLLNQMPVLVQQNPQGVQLILRPPTPQLTTTPSLVIQQNARGQPQLQTQPAQQQLLRIVGTNGATMQLAAAPTFIVSSQANLIHQTAAGQFQSAIKSGTQLTGLHAALAQAQAQAQAPRSQPFATTATLNTQLLGQSVAAQLQNLQLAAAQIQMPNGLTAISQLPAHLQQSLGGATINLNQLNGAHIQQIANAFQAPQAPGTNSGGANSTTELFTQSSPAHVPLAVTPEPLRQPTPVPMMQQQQQAAMATIQLQQQQQQQQQAQIQQLQHQLQQTQSQVQQAQQSVQATTIPEPKKKPRPRKKKQPPAPTPPAASPTVAPAEVRPPTPQKIAIAATPAPQPTVRAKSPSPPPTTIQRSSNGKLDLGDVMKFCGITGDDDDDEDYGMGLETGLASESEPAQAHAPATGSAAATTGSSGDIMISIPNQNGSDGLPFTLTIPAPQPQSSTGSQAAGNESATEIPNILIKIDPSAEAAVPPFGLSTPRLPTAEEIQKQAQQHLAQQAAAAAAAAKATTATPTINISLPSMTLQPQVTPVPVVTPTPAPSSNPVSTTVVVKPRRKPAVRRNAKKPDVTSSASNMISSSSGTTTTISSSTSTILNNSQPTTVNTITLTTPTPVTSSSNSTLMLTHGTPTAVPSQIGNIQISQVHNHHPSALPVSSAVENKIQIMPILPPGATVMGGTPGTGGHAPTTQSTQLVFQPAAPSVAPTITSDSTGFKLSSDGRQMQLVAIPQATPPSPAASSAQPPVPTPTPALTAGGATILPPQLTGMPANVSVSVGSPASAAALVPQLTGSLTLTVSEQCERLILRHDPNNPQDHQSQLILQALLKGALPNVTIINEPTRVDPNKQTTPMLQPQQQVIQIPQPLTQPQQILQQQPKVSTAPKIEVKGE